MKRVLLAIVGTVASLVMLLSFKAHSTAAVSTPAAAVSNAGNGSGHSSTKGGGTGASGGSSGSAASGTAGSSGSAGSASSAGSSGSAASYTGTAINTVYGPVQVKITIQNGTISSARAVQYPASSPRDAQINSYAIPALDSEATSASSAHIDTVSGATYTSGGYISSLQSALNKAGL